MIDATQQGELVRKAILIAIADYCDQHGHSPSVRDIGTVVGLSSSSSVIHHLGRMRAEGIINYVDRMPRSISIAKPYIYNTRRGDTNVKVISKWGKLHEQP